MRAVITIAAAYVAAIVGVCAGFPTSGTILLTAGVGVMVGLCVVAERRP